MDAAFWHQKWEQNQIGFHRNTVNAFLVEHVDALALKAGEQLFLPLCGMTLDIGWLLSKGYCVVGVELHEPAVIALFDALELTPVISHICSLKKYQAANVCIFVGDLFDLTEGDLDGVDAIYDRAAIVALPTTMRFDYAQHIMSISGRAPQLIINYEYDQTVVNGPPFSVTNEELKQHYEQYYEMVLLKQCDVDGGMKGRCPATENVWLLQRS